jgi:ABC-type tungstate transport system substrate-binding protein
VALRASSVRTRPVRPSIKDVRLGRVALTLVVSVTLLLLALHAPPFVAAGADLADGEQRDYAANIWQEMQTSLALLAIVLPWLVYGLLSGRAPHGAGASCWPPPPPAWW